MRFQLREKKIICLLQLDCCQNAYLFFFSQLEEALRLKELLEVQLDDAHETIAKEREIKLSVKRELAQYINNSRANGVSNWRS